MSCIPSEASDERSEDDDGRRPECVSDGNTDGLASDERSEDNDGRRPECVSDGNTDGLVMSSVVLTPVSIGYVSMRSDGRSPSLYIY